MMLNEKKAPVNLQTISYLNTAQLAVHFNGMHGKSASERAHFLRHWIGTKELSSDESLFWHSYMAIKQKSFMSKLKNFECRLREVASYASAIVDLTDYDRLKQVLRSFESYGYAVFESVSDSLQIDGGSSEAQALKKRGGFFITASALEVVENGMIREGQELRVQVYNQHKGYLFAIRDAIRVTGLQIREEDSSSKGFTSLYLKTAKNSRLLGLLISLNNR